MSIDEKRFGGQITQLRKEHGLTQDELASRLHVSPQAVSKWENGHSLPETALLPQLARLLDVTIDELFGLGELIIQEAFFGDGISAVSVTKRLNRLIENDSLAVTVSSQLLGAGHIDRSSYLTVKYQTPHGICHAVFPDGFDVNLSSQDQPAELPQAGLAIVAGSYGTSAHHYDVLPKIEHYKVFNWDAYHANHEVFPSDPANDETEYLTLVYLNGTGIHMATCAEGESLAYDNNGTELVRRYASSAYCLSGVPMLPSFGDGMECSWAAALTIALQGMGVQTDYTEVMGVSGACWRLAFASPGWDYSAVDGLVAYDYATPGYAAYGYSREMFGHIEKADRAEHRARIIKELRSGMPVLGINLRVAPEWGVICGYDENGDEWLCRTKYDKKTIENDPEFMKGLQPFQREWLGPYDTMRADNWPFLLCYFKDHRKPPTPSESLTESLRVFIDCAATTYSDGYAMGFEAYRVWASDLRDEAFYQGCDDGQFFRRLSVNQFCTLALCDARRAARDYMRRCAGLLPGDGAEKIAALLDKLCKKAEDIHLMLDTREYPEVEQARAFWTANKRLAQAEALDQMAQLEKEAFELAKVCTSVNQ